MYCCMVEENLIAYHEKKRVVQTYVHSIEKHTSENELAIIKIKNKIFYKQYETIVDDLYLVKYGKSYIQAGYLIYAQIALDTEVEVQDLKDAQEILLRVLEINNTTKKERKALRQTIELLNDMVIDYDTYVPSLVELKQMKLTYDPYFYNIQE